MSADLDTAATSANVPAPAEGKLRRSWLRHRRVQSSSTFVVFVAIFIGFTIWLGGGFASPSALALDIHSDVPVLLLAMSALCTLLVGKFDLSIGGTATLSNFLVIGLFVNHGWSLPLTLVVVVVASALGGLLNAALVVGVGINTFIATLGTNGLFLGISNVFANGNTLTTTPGRPIPTWFSSLGSFTALPPRWVTWTLLALAALGSTWWLRGARPKRLGQRVWDAIVAVAVLAIAIAAYFVLNLPSWVGHTSWLIIIVLIVGFLLWLFLQYTVSGRNLRATGGNLTAARLAGVPAARSTVTGYVVGAVIAGLAGVLLAASLGSATPSDAEGFLLPAFAAVFLSTVLFASGHFHVWGTILGGVFLVWVSQGLIIGGLSYNYDDIVNGVVLISAVGLSAILARRSGRGVLGH